VLRQHRRQVAVDALQRPRDALVRAVGAEEGGEVAIEAIERMAQVASGA
jgi:hypothetical protein